MNLTDTSSNGLIDWSNCGNSDLHSELSRHIADTVLQQTDSIAQFLCGQLTCADTDTQMV